MEVFDKLGLGASSCSYGVLRLLSFRPTFQQEGAAERWDNVPAGGINLHHHGSRRSDTCLLRGSENRADWSVSHGAVVMVSGSLRVLVLVATQRDRS